MLQFSESSVCAYEHMRRLFGYNVTLLEMNWYRDGNKLHLYASILKRFCFCYVFSYTIWEGREILRPSWTWGMMMMIAALEVRAGMDKSWVSIICDGEWPNYTTFVENIYFQRESCNEGILSLKIHWCVSFNKQRTPTEHSCKIMSRAFIVQIHQVVFKDKKLFQ
jgi:hypothetical protein